MSYTTEIAEYNDNDLSQEIERLEGENGRLKIVISLNDSLLTVCKKEQDRRELAALFQKYGGLPIKPDDELTVTTPHPKFELGTYLYIKDLWSWKLDSDEPMVCVSSGIIEYAPLRDVQIWRAAYLAQQEQS